MDKIDTLNHYLRYKGLNVTRQRKQIAQVFLDSSHHLSAEELYQLVRESHPAMGLSTVYRTLTLLVEAGLASRREFGDGITRYEAIARGEHHDHLICVNCGAIVEFENKKIEELQREVAEQHKFTVQRHKLELYGYCKKCRRC